MQHSEKWNAVAAKFGPVVTNKMTEEQLADEYDKIIEQENEPENEPE